MKTKKIQNGGLRRTSVNFAKFNQFCCSAGKFNCQFCSPYNKKNKTICYSSPEYIKKTTKKTPEKAK